jgi:predicted ATP-dependent serine protease
LDKSNFLPGFRPIDIASLLTEEIGEVPWVIDGYLVEGGLTLLAGAPKLGKSTFTYEAVIAIAAGRAFLGRKVLQGNVLILGLEEHRRDIAARLRANGADDLAGRIKIDCGPLPYTPGLLAQMARFIQSEDIRLVLIDTIPALWGLKDENDASEVLRNGCPLLAAIRSTKAAWLGLAHTRKSGGENGEAIRGSSALLGLVDIAITMKRTAGHNQQRVLESVSRYSETPRELFIELTDEGYRSMGGADDISIEGKAERLLKVLDDAPKTASELITLSGLTKQDLSRAVAYLGSKVQHTGAGHRGDPYQYVRNSIHPTPATSPWTCQLFETPIGT